MKPWTCSRLTSTPLTSPIAAATASASSTAGSTLAGWPAMMPAAITPVRLATKGTERSRLPQRMTSVCPMAMKPRMLVAVRMSRRLPVLKKLRPSIAVRTVPRTTAATSTSSTIPVEVRRAKRLIGRPRPRSRRRSPAAAPAPPWNRRQLAGEAAVAHHEDPVRHADHLGQLAGDHEDRDALLRQHPHQLVDRVLRPHVDAAGRLVHAVRRRAGSRATGRARPSAGCRRRGTAPPGRARGPRPRGCSAGRAPPAGRGRCGAGRPRAPDRGRCRGSTG